MKTIFLTSVILLMCTFTHGQNLKTIVATYTSAGQWGEWSGLIFMTSDQKEMRFLNKTASEIELRGLWTTEPSAEDPMDPTAEIHTQSGKVGQAFKITYAVQNVSYKGYDSGGGVIKKENVIVYYEPAETEDLKAASCKVFSSGLLKGVTLNNVIYEIYYTGKKNDGQPIQNKTELCKRDKCSRLFIEPDGKIYTYQLPNVTDKILWGRIQGNEILKYKKPYKSEEEFKKTGITFTGDRQQAAMTAILHRWYE